jgi:CBS domain containing-hemolysin-like protein
MKLFSFVLLALIMILFAVPVFAQDSTSAYSFPAWFTLVVGTVVLPLVSQVLLKNVLSDAAKFWIVIALSIVTGVVGLFILKVPLNDSVKVAGAVWTLSQWSYYSWWKKIFSSDSISVLKSKFSK